MGLKFVQFSKNSSYHSGIKQSPYKALFGCDPRAGLQSTRLPTEMLDQTMTESDLFAAIQPESTSSTTQPSLSQATD